jgi:hypothetical protein
MEQQEGSKLIPQERSSFMGPRIFHRDGRLMAVIVRLQVVRDYWTWRRRIGILLALLRKILNERQDQPRQRRACLHSSTGLSKSSGAVPGQVKKGNNNKSQQEND